MQRRKVELGDPGANSALMTPDASLPSTGLNASTAATAAATMPVPNPSATSNTAGLNQRSKRLTGSKANSNLTLNIVLLSIVVLVVFVFLFPSQVAVDRSFEAPVGKRVEDFRRKSTQKHRSQEEIEFELRQRILKEPPKAEVPDRRKSKEASETMERQPSYWVDGERKLKQKLKVLYERQQKGIDLGVPILTRYLGEDIPAWLENGKNEKEWRAMVDAKYDEMKGQEKKWREEMRKIIEKEVEIPY